jgi:hypothetical protein
MATVLFGIAGAVIGSYFDAPGLGYAIGSTLGNAFFGGGGSQNSSSEGPRLNDLRVQGSAYGSAIPIHYGRNRLSGQIIWASPITEHATTTAVDGGGGKGGGRIWFDGNLFYDARGSTVGGIYAGSSSAASLVFYPGDEKQAPDPTIEAHLGSGNVNYSPLSRPFF